MEGKCTMNKVQTLNEEIIQYIMISFIKLLEYENFEKISIVEIITKAGLSRNSFYRNFSSKEDILKQYITRVTDDFICNANIPILEISWGKYIETILRHLYKQRAFVDILIRNNKLYLISDIFDKAIQNRINGRVDYNHALFLSGGLFNIYKFWAQSGYKESPEIIAKSFEIPILGI